MSKYVLRWQYGVYAGEKRTHHTYGGLEMLREKAKVLAENDEIVYITIDKTVEVLKDIRMDRIHELALADESQVK